MLNAFIDLSNINARGEIGCNVFVHCSNEKMKINKITPSKVTITVEEIATPITAKTTIDKIITPIITKPANDKDDNIDDK